LAWCLPTYVSDAFLAKLKKGEIDPIKLAEMTSKDRRASFVEIFGKENAEQVNRLFESKLLLKNQQRGMVTWAKTMAGLKPQAQRDVLSRINRLEEALNPATEQAFLEDLVSHKLGNTVTMQEAGKLSGLSKIATQKKEAMLNGGDRMEYGYARVAFENYLEELKASDSRSFLQKTKDYMKSPTQIITDIFGISKSALSTLDDSWLGRQGWKLIFSHPKQWGKTVTRSFQDIWDTFGGKKVMDHVKADAHSRPNNLNGSYKKDKLAISVTEEQFPQSELLEKIPGFGRVHKAAENAFTAAAYRNRMDLYDLYYDMAKKSGIEDPTGKGIGKLVNSLTSRASLGRLEPSADVVNKAFFSGRKLKSDFDFLTAHTLSKDISPFVRKQAAYNLLRTVTGTAAVLTLANAVSPGSVEWDPRSSDFGQIKVGNSRFDVTGGMKSIVTLASRLITGATKSSTTGKVYDINSGKYGAMEGTDLIYSFFENKTSPGASVIRDLLRDRTFSGEKPTFTGILQQSIVPLPIQTFLELQDNPESADLLLSMMAEAIGISVNTYAPGGKANRATTRQSTRERASTRERLR